MKCQGILLTSLRISNVNYPYLNLFSLNTRRYYRTSAKRNPYDVLGVKNTCSTKDVKKAYIKLCKELHPDMKPGDDSQHKKFVELNNAYTTLVNTESRRLFDNESSVSSSYEDSDWKHNNTYRPFNQDTGQREKHWYEREEYRQYYQQPYKSNQRLNYTWTLFGCLVLVIFGSILTFSAYSYATKYTLNIVDKRSKKISEDYSDLRKKALAGNKEEQVEELRKRWNL